MDVPEGLKQIRGSICRHEALYFDCIKNCTKFYVDQYCSPFIRKYRDKRAFSAPVDKRLKTQYVMSSDKCGYNILCFMLTYVPGNAIMYSVAFFRPQNAADWVINMRGVGEVSCFR